MEQVFELGDVRVTVETPDGVGVHGALIDLRPQTAEEFETMVAALGGIERLRLPDGTHYTSPAYADRTANGEESLGVMIYPPPDAVAAVSGPRPHPFFGRYAPEGS